MSDPLTVSCLMFPFSNDFLHSRLLLPSSKEL